MHLSKAISSYTIALILCGLTACGSVSSQGSSEEKTSVGAGVDTQVQSEGQGSKTAKDPSPADDPHATGIGAPPMVHEGSPATLTNSLLESHQAYAKFLGVDADEVKKSYEELVAASPDQITASLESLDNFEKFIYQQDSQIRDALNLVKAELTQVDEAADYYVDSDKCKAHLDAIEQIFSHTIRPRVLQAATLYGVKLRALSAADKDGNYLEALQAAEAPVLKKFSLNATSESSLISSLETLFESATIVYTQPDSKDAKAGIANFVNGSDIFYFGNGHGGFGVVSVDDLRVYSKYKISGSVTYKEAQATPSQGSSDSPKFGSAPLTAKVVSNSSK